MLGPNLAVEPQKNIMLADELGRTRNVLFKLPAS
jgi:hypothetical protein